MRHAALVVLSLCGFVTASCGQVATTATAAIPGIAQVGINLGSQVTRAMMMRSDFGRDKDGRLVMYTTLLGNPAAFVITDVETAKVLRAHHLPGTSGAWNVMTAKDGTVYIGAYNAGVIYRYFPETDTVENLGFPFKTHDAVVYPSAEGPDGKIYGGTYPSGHAYEYNPASKTFRDLGDMTTTTAAEKWLRATRYDAATNKLYFGIGNQPQLVEYDLATGKKRDLLPARYADITSVYDLDVAGGRLFCRKETANPYEFFVLDQATGQTIPVTNADTGETSDTFVNASRGMSPPAPGTSKLYYIARDYKLWEYNLANNSIHALDIPCPSVATGYHWAQLAHPAWPGWTLICTTGNTGQLFRYNPATNRHDARSVDYPGQPVNIHDVEHGPDGRIYSGGYLAGNMGIYDPATSTVTHLSGSGQTEGLVFLGKKLYMGVYPGAGIFEYDTEKPWSSKASQNSSGTIAQNPRKVFSLENNDTIAGYTSQDRPFAMAVAPALQKLVVGTVPKNGMLGGALAVWDAKAGGEPEVYWNIIPDQSIVALACIDGIAYGATSTHGGLGATPKAKEARLFAWDLAGKKMLYNLAPVPGRSAITQLLARPDGTVWGLAGDTLFIFDPQQEKVIYSKVEFTRPNVGWRDGSLLNGPDGNVYGTMDRRLFKVDATTRKLEFMATGLDKITCDDKGNLYGSGSPITELWQVPAAAAKP